MPLNRVVVILTPLVFAPLAGFITLQAAKLGINLDGSHTQDLIISGAVFLGGVIVAHLKSRKWLQGWQAWEKRHDDAANASLDVNFTRFLEELAEKTGTKLPSEENLPLVATEDRVTGSPPPAFAPGAMGPDAS